MKLASSGCENLSQLSQHLLRSANQEAPLVDFLEQVTQMLLTFCAADTVELWVRRDETWLHFRSATSGPRSFRLETTPSAKAPHQLAGTRIQPYSLSVPIVAGDETVGCVEWRSRRRSYFTPKNARALEEVARALGLTLVSQLAQTALRERVKELTCLYQLAQLAERPEATLQDILAGVVDLLPTAWQYPAIARARVVLDDKVRETPGFLNAVEKLSADLFIGGKRRGCVEVAYVEPKLVLDEGPFLKEERKLIDTIAKQVALIAERRHAAEERLQLQRQLRHADRLATIGQLAAGVAHELNEPLGNILAFAQLIAKQPKLQRQAVADTQKIVKASLHAREIVKKLMFFARQMPPQKLPVNLNEVVREGLYFIESRCAKAGIELQCRLTRRMPQVTADPSQLHQVLINLLINAIQAMPDGGILRITTQKARQQVMFAVEDNGIGMSAEVQRKIFIPFFTTKGVNKGTGLGLPVVLGIVNAHAGTIAVHSQPGKGSRFEVCLPLVGPELEAQNQKQ